MKIAIIGNFSHSLDDPSDRELIRFIHSFTERLGKHHTVAYYGQKEELQNATSHQILTDNEIKERQKLLNAGKAMAALSIVNKAYVRTLKEVDVAGFDLVHNISDQLAPLAASSRLSAILVTTLFRSPDKNRVNFMNDNPEIVDSYFCAPTIGIKKAWKKSVSNLDIAHIPSGSLPATEEITLNMGAPKRKALWVGDIKKGCGLELAAQACALAGVGMNIVGDLEDKEFYREKVLPHLTNEDRFLGPPDKVDLKELMEESRIGLWTAEFSGPLPLTALKMLASGLPIVGINCPSMESHITKEIGALARKNKEDIALAIKGLKDHCRVKIQQKTVNTYGASESTARYMEIFKFVKALQDESKKQQAYRHLCSSSWRGTLGQN